MQGHQGIFSLVISKSYIPHVSTKQGTQGAEYNTNFQKDMVMQWWIHKGTLSGNCKFLLEQFRGSKATTMGHGSNRLHCHRKLSGLMLLMVDCLPTWEGEGRESWRKHTRQKIVEEFLPVRYRSPIWACKLTKTTSRTGDLFTGFLRLVSYIQWLKTLDTIGNCQRPVFPLGVSQHYMHKITNLWKFGCRSCEIIMKEKTPLSNEVVCV